MRGRREPQATMLAFVDLEARVPQEHPLRTIKAIADGALAERAIRCACGNLGEKVRGCCQKP